MIKQIRASHPVTFADVFAALGKGWHDFTRAPLMGIFFGGMYTLAGVLLYLLLSYYRSVWLILPLAIGFPLIGPFVAAGLYEMSRRLARGEQLWWGEILTVTLRQSRREFGWMAFVVLFILWVWMYQVRLLVAFLMGYKGFASLDGFIVSLTQADGIKFLLIGTALGAVLSFVLFCSTVVAMPMLLHKDTDFVSALINSWRTVFENLPAMVFFGLVIAVLTFLALLPMFFGLIVVLPVLGHATWHLYVASRHIEDRPS
jgi:uncharacterized membrane protein